MRFVALVLLAAVVGGCTNQSAAQEAARRTAADRTFYAPTNDVEFRNYQSRLRLADQPTTIWWCTSSFNTPNSPMFTVPIVGKVTSGNKRPFEADLNRDTIGQDGMYGSSADYLYGFGPDGTYSQWSAVLPVYCTTIPTVWQREATTIVSASDPALLAAQEAAQALLAKGDTAGAQKVLQDAITAAGGK